MSGDIAGRGDDQQGELARGWPVILACLIGMMLGISAIPFYTLGIFALPVTGEFGWDMAAYQGAFFWMVAAAFTAPLTGYLCDRFGVRWVAIISAAGFGLALASIGVFTTANVASFYALWAVMAFVGQGTGPISWTRALGEWFYARRGLALGIALMGSGITAFVAPPLATWLIGEIGWRMTYVALGGLVLLVSVPALLIGLRAAPAEVLDAGRKLGGGLSADFGVTLPVAMRTRQFWIIGIGFLLVSLGVAGIISNLPPMLIGRGFSSAQAGQMAALIGVSVVLGRLVVGYLLDRFWGPGIAAVLMALPAASCLVLASSDLSPSSTAVAVFVVGFAAGAEFDIIAYFVSRYFGMKHYGKIYSIQYMIFFLGAGIAPALFGRVYDTTGSYDPILLAVAGAFLLAATMLLFLGRYPDHSENADARAR